MSHTKDAEMPMPARQESDRTAAPSVPKSLTLNSTRSGVGTGNFGGYGMTNGAEKPSVLHMIMEALGLRNQAQNREPTSKDIGTLIMLGVMFLLFVISVTGFFVMWFTEYYNNTILENLILAENSDTANSWLNPDPKYDTLLKAHIFHYPNIDDYLAGRADKIKVVDVGPLTYQEHTVKDEVSFNKNFTVSFRDRKSYKFLPEKSSIGEHEVVRVPNVPLISAAGPVKRMKAFERLAVSTWIKQFKEPLFKELTVSEYLWGYEDSIIKLKSLGRGRRRFGLLMSRNGTSVDSVQLNTGEDDITKFSIITQFNGMPQLDYWEGDECNRIDGSEPSMFSPHLLQDRSTVNVFLQVLCRKVPLHFEKEVTIYNDIDVLRYRTPMDVFSHPSKNPANQCYCRNTELCLPSGVINATKCYGDAPIFPSFPHFFTGDPVLYQDFEGIEPDAAVHQTYADIHPRFGFPISGASRVQINIMLDKTPILRNQGGRLKNTTILPLMWIEITSGDFSEEVLHTLYLSTFGLNAIQQTLKYGTLLISVTSFSLIVAGVYYLNSRREEQLQESKTSAELEALNGGENIIVVHHIDMPVPLPVQEGGNHQGT
ncbi:scavenger receptor class B member 1 [Drosophila simulans]|uniref:GD11915 n=2 Tax=melanogaster subgroup TaxID=32351 RepID=B4QD56_DROSI|nr:scavenger receptor class B member 1 [Drosophila simulans]XP_016029579.1 scavenger receptor class B member 1 [Drosophila simulans]XP_016029580.1 scavenger receptor class B member 1 [Drosophila simulans]XP_033155372.1 scavenger receptor class B member 1 [Drosophila mauritiana]XP_033155373.1 scavenger receptor class B member 1 [Drosophila mauritiana]XP_033155374.1 scavenger receptor class B member 1 [Drosophila mauritiana]XP_033155375.1 scavenger receptor class B member 1 [Drosophila mauritia